MMRDCPRCPHFRFTSYAIDLPNGAQLSAYRCDLSGHLKRGDIRFIRACEWNEHIHGPLSNVIALLELIAPSIELEKHDHNI